jgi:hypothetical protein
LMERVLLFLVFLGENVGCVLGLDKATLHKFDLGHSRHDTLSGKL